MPSNAKADGRTPQANQRIERHNGAGDKAVPAIKTEFRSCRKIVGRHWVKIREPTEFCEQAREQQNPEGHQRGVQDYRVGHLRVRSLPASQPIGHTDRLRAAPLYVDVRADHGGDEGSQPHDHTERRNANAAEGQNDEGLRAARHGLLQEKGKHLWTQDTEMTNLGNFKTKCIRGFVDKMKLWLNNWELKQ